MKSRITLSITEDGLFEIWMNREGRDELVRKLKLLDEQYEHLHLEPDETGDIELSTVAYRPSDKVFEYGKILFRIDEWDREHFPHVLEPAR